MKAIHFIELGPKKRTPFPPSCRAAAQSAGTPLFAPCFRGKSIPATENPMRKQEESAWERRSGAKSTGSAEFPYNFYFENSSNNIFCTKGKPTVAEPSLRTERQYAIILSYRHSIIGFCLHGKQREAPCLCAGPAEQPPSAALEAAGWGRMRGQQENKET